MIQQTALFLVLLLSSVIAECDPSTVPCSAECKAAGVGLIDFTGGCFITRDKCMDGKKRCTGGDEFLKGCMLLGYVSDANSLCRLPTDAECLQKNTNFCLYRNSACRYYNDFPQNTATGQCVAPTDTECLNSNNYACNVAQQQCVKTNGFPANQEGQGKCVAPSNCSDVSGYKPGKGSHCKSGKTYCLAQGFTKKSDDDDCECTGIITNSNQCVAPSDSDCLNQSNTLCNSETSKCVVVNGFAQNFNNGKCDAPSDCTAASGSHCKSGKTYCLAQGFTKKSDGDDCECTSFINSSKCVGYSDSDCLNHTFLKTIYEKIILKINQIISQTYRIYIKKLHFSYQIFSIQIQQFINYHISFCRGTLK